MHKITTETDSVELVKIPDMARGIVDAIWRQMWSQLDLKAKVRLTVTLESISHEVVDVSREG